MPHAPAHHLLHNSLQVTCHEDAHKFIETSPEPSEDIAADCAQPETARPEFPLAGSGTVESPEAESQVELPQCVEGSAPATEAGAAYESPAPKACFRFAALVSQHSAVAHMHCRSHDPHGTKTTTHMACWARSGTQEITHIHTNLLTTYAVLKI